MKTTLTLILAFLLAGPLSAQQRVRKIVPVLSQQNFLLNGGMNATMLNGKSRQEFTVRLPEHTVAWYYILNTYLQGDGGQTQLALASQLTRLLDPSGTTAIAVSSIFAPTGVAYADVYLMNEPNARVFISKGDLAGQELLVFREYSRWNFKSGIVDIARPMQGTFFLGVKNPSSTSPINVSLEIAAIVEEEVAQTDSQNKAELYGNLGWTSYEKGDYESCITLSQKALSYDDNLPWVKCNLALCYLVMGRPDYLDRYVDAIACCKKSPQARRYLEAARKDIRNARLASNASAKQVLQLIEMELQ